MKKLITIILGTLALNSLAQVSPTPNITCNKLISSEELASKNEVAQVVTFVESSIAANCGEAILKNCGWFGTDRENYEIKCTSEKAVSTIKIEVRKNKSKGLYIKEVLLSTKY